VARGQSFLASSWGKGGQSIRRTTALQRAKVIINPHWEASSRGGRQSLDWSISGKKDLHKKKQTF
jgi:hypothetical protein